MTTLRWAKSSWLAMYTFAVLLTIAFSYACERWVWAHFTRPLADEVAALRREVDGLRASLPDRWEADVAEMQRQKHEAAELLKAVEKAAGPEAAGGCRCSKGK